MHKITASMHPDHDQVTLITALGSQQRPMLEAVYMPGNDGESGEIVFWSQIAPGGPQLPQALLSLADASPGDQEQSLEELGFFSRQVPLILPRPRIQSSGRRNKALSRKLIEGRSVSCYRLLELLGPLALDSQQRRQFGPLRLGSSLEVYVLISKLALELAVGQRFVPSMKSREGRQGYRCVWTADLGRDEDRRRFQNLVERCPSVAHCLSVSSRNREVWAPYALLRRFLDDCIDTLVRAAMDGQVEDIFRDGRWSEERTPSWEKQWLRGLTNFDNNFAGADAGQNRHLPAELEQWNAVGRGQGQDQLRLGLRLDPPGEDPEQDQQSVKEAFDQQGRWRMRFLAQAPDDPSLIVPIERVWQHAGADLVLWERRFPRSQEQLLAALGRAARVFEPLSTALMEAAPKEVELSTEQVAEFLMGSFHVLREMGVEIIFPLELTSEQSQLQAKLVVGADQEMESTGLFGEHLYQSYRWEAAIGDEQISADEFHAIAELKSSLIRWRGRWLRVEPDQVASMDTFLRRRSRQVPSGADVLSTALGGDALADELQVDVDVQLEGPLAKLFDVLTSGGFEPLPAPEGFVGELRPYQQWGVGWLAGLSQVGLGGCLADDMGLGKTIQVIAWLLYQFQEEEPASPADSNTVLIVCPTSLLGNWRAELKRFAPELSVHVHYGPGRARSATTLAAKLQESTVILTSYHTVRRDQELLQSIEWKAVITDEAQNIKNPSSKLAQSVHGLKAPQRLALSGTPIENRLAELWSILQFTTPGLLGSYDSFQEKVARPIERFRDQRSIERLQKLVKPFVLRRSKTDPTIISDLPEKQELLSYCLLTREQASLYQAKVDETLESIQLLTGFERAAKLLSSLTALKQICNHPAQYLKERGPLVKRSGKLDRLESIVEQAVDNDESVLVFTQYAAMGRLLQQHLKSLYAADVLFLHGGTSQKQRQSMVQRFQEGDGQPRIFILSLKAGGTGLNLTKASCVVHFDRWWNPAVEDQATDRAYRIGQTKQVNVHKLVCSGTLEERINQLLDSKRDLAEQALGSANDRWMTQLSNEELADLLCLDRDVLVSEEGEEA